MNAKDIVENAKYWGMITEDHKVNYEGVHILQEINGWKEIARPYKDDVHGWCVAKMWVKDNLISGGVRLEKGHPQATSYEPILKKESEK